MKHPFTVDLNGESAMRAMFRSRSCEFDTDCNYSIDAPERIPAGSTQFLTETPDWRIATSSSYWRET